MLRRLTHGVLIVLGTTSQTKLSTDRCSLLAHLLVVPHLAEHLLEDDFHLYKRDHKCIELFFIPYKIVPSIPSFSEDEDEEEEEEDEESEEEEDDDGELSDGAFLSIIGRP